MRPTRFSPEAASRGKCCTDFQPVDSRATSQRRTVLFKCLRMVALIVIALGVTDCGQPWGQPSDDVPETVRAVAEQYRTDSARLVTGGDEHLRSVVRNEGGVAGGAFFEFVPVEPLNGSVYPEGTNITGNTITIPGGPMRVWFDVYFGGWGRSWGERLKTVQAKMDGENGFVSGAGDPLARPVEECTETGPPPHPTCGALFSGTHVSFGSLCIDGLCQPAWQDKSRPNYAIHGPSLADASSDNYRWGSTASPDFQPYDDGTTFYAGSGVIEIPPGAAGTYTIPILEVGTFMIRDDGHNTLVAFTTTPLVIEIPTGTCCYTPESVEIACEDELTQTQCMLEFPEPSYWNQGANCADFPCDPLLGACCERATGTCAVTLHAECPTANDPLSSWMAGVLCDEVDCEAALGACCDRLSGACSQTLRADCPGIDEPDFSWLMGIPCAANGCPLPYEPIPTLSEWGLVVMTLLLLIGAKIYFGRSVSALTT